MNHILFGTVSLAMLAAQFGLGQGGPPPGGRGAPPPAKQTIDFVTAKKIAAAVEAAAVAEKAVVSIAVVDSSGDLVYFQRMDDAAARAVTSAQGKARAALLFGIPTKQVNEAITSGKPVSLILTAPVGTNELTTMQGGLPLLKDGKTIAAVGVGGSSPANDEKFAQAGLDALAGGK